MRNTQAQLAQAKLIDEDTESNIHVAEYINDEERQQLKMLQTDINELVKQMKQEMADREAAMMRRMEEVEAALIAMKAAQISR